MTEPKQIVAGQPSMTIEEVTKSAFADCLSQTFALRIGGEGEIKIRLAAVETLGPFAEPSPTLNETIQSGTGRRESFSLEFIAPGNWRGSQGIYSIQNEQLGELDVFLVPLGPDERGMRLEAVFNFAS
jgi:hypothetical protein